MHERFYLDAIPVSNYSGYFGSVQKSFVIKDRSRIFDDISVRLGPDAEYICGALNMRHKLDAIPKEHLISAEKKLRAMHSAD